MKCFKSVVRLCLLNVVVQLASSHHFSNQIEPYNDILGIKVYAKDFKRPRESFVMDIGESSGTLRKSRRRRSYEPLRPITDFSCNVTESELEKLTLATANVSTDIQGLENFGTTFAPCRVTSKHMTNLVGYIKEQSGIVNKINSIEYRLLRLLRNNLMLELTELNGIAEILKQQIPMVQAEIKTLQDIAQDMYAQYSKSEIKAEVQTVKAKIQAGYYKHNITERTIPKFSATDLKTLIELSYEGRLEHFKNVLSFIRKLACGNAIIVFPALHKVMKENNHLASPEMLLLEAAAEERCSKELAYLLTELKDYSERILDNWANLVRDGNYSSVVSFFASVETNWEFDSLVRHIPFIIRTSFSRDIRNFKNTTLFIGLVPNVPSHYVGFKAIVDEMVNNGFANSFDMQRLLYMLHDYLDDAPFTGYNKPYREKIMDLIQSIPKAARDKFNYDTWKIIMSGFKEDDE